MIDLEAGRFQVRATMEHGADAWTAETADPQDFIGAAEAERYTIESGYRDAGNTPYTRGRISSGVADQVRLVVRGREQRVQVQGKDAAALLLDQPVRMLFRRQVKVGLSTSVSALGLPTIGLTDKGAGIWRASQIADAVVAPAGARVAWEVPDYELLRDFTAQGPPLEIVRRLASVWDADGQLEPFPVDVWVEGTTLVVRQRSLTPGAPTFTMSVFDARIRELAVTKWLRPVRFGTVILSGRLAQAGATQVTVDGTRYPGKSGDEPVVTTRVEVDQHTLNSPLTGQPMEHTTRIRTYRMPDGVLLSDQTFTFLPTPPTKVLVPGLDPEEVTGLSTSTFDTVVTLGGELELRSVHSTWNDFETVAYDKGRPVKTPDQKSQITLTQGRSANDKAQLWRNLALTTVGFEYDLAPKPAFLNTKTTIRYTLNLKKDLLDPTEMTIEGYQDVAPQWVEKTTTLYKRKAVAGKTDEFEWFNHSSDVHTANGYRPGGPGRNNALPPVQPEAGSATGGAGDLRPIQLSAVLSTSPTAVDVAFGREDLDEDHLDTLMASFRGANGKRRVQVEMTAAGMPGLRKGATLQLTGLVAADGTAIPLPPVLVFDEETNYSEERSRPELMATITGRGWQ